MSVVAVGSGHHRLADLFGAAANRVLEPLGNVGIFLEIDLRILPALTDPNRAALVGLVPVDGKTPIRAGSHLVVDPKVEPPVPMIVPVSFVYRTIWMPFTGARRTGSPDETGVALSVKLLPVRFVNLT